jgi:hypothetical protein
MGRKSSTGGVIPAGLRRIQFDFRIDGVRFRPTLPWQPHATNLRRAGQHLQRIKARIRAGTFRVSEEFPDYRLVHRMPLAAESYSCNQVFDMFVRHCEARVALKDLGALTSASHRRILDRVWRPEIGTLPFLGVRHSGSPASTDTAC